VFCSGSYERQQSHFRLPPSPPGEQATSQHQARQSRTGDRTGHGRRRIVKCDAGNVALGVARAAAPYLKEIRGTEVSKLWQRYGDKPRVKVHVATKLYITAGAGSVRVNKEVEERRGMIVLSGDVDHVLRTRTDEIVKVAVPNALGANLISDPPPLRLAPPVRTAVLRSIIVSA